MKNKVVTKDEWCDDIGEYLKKFRYQNPYYPIDPFKRVDEMRMEFIMDDNHRHQIYLRKALQKEIIEEWEEAPY